MAWIEDGFIVPARLETQTFVLRPLLASDAELDYAAVMESQIRLRAGSPSGWPRPGFTLRENRADLATHEQECADRTAFTYTVITPADDRVLGCVYIRPSESADADVYLWVRDSEHDMGGSGLTRSLFEAVTAWLAAEWPFREINFIRRSYYLDDAGEHQALR